MLNFGEHLLSFTFHLCQFFFKVYYGRHLYLQYNVRSEIRKISSAKEGGR